MYLLIKIAQKLFSPLGLSLLLLCWLLVGRGAFRRFTALFGLLVLFVPSLPVVSDLLMTGLERAAPPTAPTEMPTAPAIVVLGGTAAPEWGDGYKAEELAGSRLLGAFRLYRAEKAPQIIVTSGISYLTADGAVRTESEDMRDILIDYGVLPDAIVLESQAQTTEQNALYTAKILRAAEIKEIILVTSAYHMQRASLWFILEGIKVTPYGSGYAARGNELRFLDFLPSATALSRSSAAIKEYLGLIPVAWKTKEF